MSGLQIDTVNNGIIPSTGVLTVVGTSLVLTDPATLNSVTLSSTGFPGSTTSAITNDATTNATMYPVWVTANTGTLPLKVSSTKLSFNPSTGVVTSTGFTGALNGTLGATTPAAVAATSIICSANLAVNTNKFTVNATTGETLISGNGFIGGSFNVGPASSYDKFTVANATGNTVIAGTLNVTGVITSSANHINFATQTPASASATGTAGDVAWDADFIYICTATDTWKRVAIATW